MKKLNANKKVILEKMVHYSAGLVILIKGITKLEHEETLFVGLIFFLISVLIIGGTIFHQYVEKKIGHMKSLIFLLEGLVSLILGYVYIIEGKHFIQYACFIASIGFTISFLVSRKKMKYSVPPTPEEKAAASEAALN